MDLESFWQQNVGIIEFAFTLYLNFENAKEFFLKSFSLPLGYAAWETDEVSKLQGAHLLQINDKSTTMRITFFCKICKLKNRALIRILFVKTFWQYVMSLPRYPNEIVFPRNFNLHPQKISGPASKRLMSQLQWNENISLLNSYKDWNLW